MKIHICDMCKRNNADAKIIKADKAEMGGEE